jgi:MauM/NapG family ferredoxin protein
MSAQKKEEAEEPSRLESGPQERFHRRGFFAEGLRHLLRPLADLVEKRVEGLSFPDEADAHDDHSIGGSSMKKGAYGSGEAYSPAFGRTLLRPPGALKEDEFLRRCTSCGKCVEVCPVSAIKLIPDDDPLKDRKPAIEASVQACVVCDDLSCMKACPSGALRSLNREEIRMGTAVLRRDLCVRTFGEDCRICADKCPLGPKAIEIPQLGGEVLVKTEGCIGCGVCEMYCPTEPKAIVIEPAR